MRFDITPNRTMKNLYRRRVFIFIYILFYFLTSVLGGGVLLLQNLPHSSHSHSLRNFNCPECIERQIIAIIKFIFISGG